ncbi:thiamine biosynthetic bifunctional enzyme [Cryptotrichosporon argae]
MGKVEVDYSLYLVTGRELLPPGKDYYESLEESLKGGVTVVQIREKTADTGEFVEVARRTKEITDKYNVPLLINDRIDVFLAVGAAGIHIGQTDMPLALARALAGPGAVVGVSTGSVAEARAAVDGGADYVGIGPVWATQSKDVTHKTVLGPDGAGAILEELAGTGVRSVAIGGIQPPNVAFLLHGSISPDARNHLDGIAVISAVVSSREPERAARDLRAIVDSFKRARRALGDSVSSFTQRAAGAPTPDADALLRGVEELMRTVRDSQPLVHQITNNVVVNDSANVTLAVGASPIMATHPRDVADLSAAIGALLINFGTIQDKEGVFVAGRHANMNRKPIVFDPVAVGATAFRRETATQFLHHWQPAIIKGNAAEIGALAQSTEVLSRGVDSVGAGFADPGSVVKALARKRGAVVVLTGKHDYISDGEVVLRVSNGHDLLGTITGSGCQTGSLIATFAAAARTHCLAAGPATEDESQLTQGDMLLAALAGVLVYTVAAEVAAARPDVKGPGTFRAALIDELYNLRAETVLARAHVEVLSA